MEPSPDPSGDSRPFADRLADALPALAAYASRLARGAERDELVQETAARALRSAERHDPQRPLGPWLRRTLLRAWIDARERAARRPRAVADLEPAIESGALRAVDDGEEAERWLARLAPEERTLLVDFHVEGRGVRDLAAERGVPEGTIKARLSRARRKLAALRETGNDDAEDAR